MILIDTGPIVAIIDREDEHFAVATEIVLGITEVLVTTEACLTEAIYLIGKSAGRQGVELLRVAVDDGVIEVLPQTQDWHARSFAFMERFADQPCD